MGQLEGAENIIFIKYIKEKERNDETFKTREINKILKIYQDFKNKAIQFSDIQRIKKDERRKERQIKKNVNNMFNMW